VAILCLSLVGSWGWASSYDDESNLLTNCPDVGVSVSKKAEFDLDNVINLVFPAGVKHMPS
jgi:hypothetical protein